MQPPKIVEFIKRRPERWSRYPKAIRLALLESVGKIERIREEIARTARVRTMPFVRIYDEIWAAPNGNMILGHAPETIEKEGGFFAAVGLPAPTAVCPDDEAVRAILVHEFNHCFRFQRLLVDAADAGTYRLPDFAIPGSGRDPEMAMHENPFDWFSEEDARGFVLNHDGSPLPFRIADNSARMNLALHLPIVQTPHETESSAKPCIADDVTAHVRRLRG